MPTIQGFAPGANVALPNPATDPAWAPEYAQWLAAGLQQPPWETPEHQQFVEQRTAAFSSPAFQRMVDRLREVSAALLLKNLPDNPDQQWEATKNAAQQAWRYVSSQPEFADIAKQVAQSDMFGRAFPQSTYYVQMQNDLYRSLRNEPDAVKELAGKVDEATLADAPKATAQHLQNVSGSESSIQGYKAAALGAAGGKAPVADIPAAVAAWQGAPQMSYQSKPTPQAPLSAGLEPLPGTQIYRPPPSTYELYGAPMPGQAPSIQQPTGNTFQQIMALQTGAGGPTGPTNVMPGQPPTPPIPQQPSFSEPMEITDILSDQASKAPPLPAAINADYWTKGTAENPFEAFRKKGIQV